MERISLFDSTSIKLFDSYNLENLKETMAARKPITSPFEEKRKQSDRKARLQSKRLSSPERENLRSVSIGYRDRNLSRN